MPTISFGIGAELIMIIGLRAARGSNLEPPAPTSVKANISSFFLMSLFHAYVRDPTSAMLPFRMRRVGSTPPPHRMPALPSTEGDPSPY